MKIKAHVTNYKLTVLSNEGIEMLSAGADNISLEADVWALVNEFSRRFDIDDDTCSDALSDLLNKGFDRTVRT